jgi:hypothetical protein
MAANGIKGIRADQVRVVKLKVQAGMRHGVV